MFTGIRGGRLLLPDGNITETDLRIDDGCIADVGRANGHSLDADGLLVLPGIVDIHGDAFERQLMPRPKVHFPVDVALVDTDRQLLANGITTAYHGITCSWEGGLRGTEQAASLIDSISGDALPLGADHRVHLRFETFHLDAVDQVIDWIEDGHVDFLAFNEHLSHMQQKLGNGGLEKYAERSGVSETEFRTLLERIATRADDVPAAIVRIATHARSAGLALASHDDDTEAQRHWFHAQGCHVSEFPRTEEALQTARRLDNHVILGAPNVMRGGSHCKAIGAAETIARGLCNVLASDYYYPALAGASFRLVRDGVTDFANAWRLVSCNPARAAGLADRGEIAVGQRADIVLIDDSDPRMPTIQAVLIAGEQRYAARPLRLR
ncbi:MAG TPA: alpha-D-ribose 1-methylphosphonate 5-triphosphate diphosphatase [Burkholderiales bacterium]|nr:alpha-D-ribose 1-methylphosphonate 5-triphosphate diphosphatase [Burkholderiales bacterium]